MKRMSGVMSEKDWNFRPLIHESPTDEQRWELKAATCYEYARESDSIRKLAAEYAALPDDLRCEAEEKFSLTPIHAHPCARHVSPSLVYMDTIPFWNCILWPEFFPETAWMEIARSVRKARVQRYREANAPKPLVRINKFDVKDGWRVPTRNGRSITGSVGTLVLEVDWAAGNNSDIVAALAPLIGKMRPRTIPEPRGDNSRDNVSAGFLTRLAVMRLLNRYPFSQAYDLAADRGFKIPSEPNNALKMRRQAKLDLHRFFHSADLAFAGKNLFIRADERPRSWEMPGKRRTRVR